MADIYAIARPGTVYACGACGKRARSAAGVDAAGKSTKIDAGWDESCMLHAVLCWDSPILPLRAVIVETPTSGSIF